MIKLFNKKFIKKLFYFLLFLSLNYNSTYADILKEFKITGNDRLAKETLIMFSELDIGNNVSQNDFSLYSRSFRGRFIIFGFSYGFGKGEAMEYSGARRYF